MEPFMSLTTSVHVSTTFPLNYCPSRWLTGWVLTTFSVSWPCSMTTVRWARRRRLTPCSGMGKEKKEAAVFFQVDGG